ncbi:MAG: YggS family pyridoxal phosphate-dependent enzyme [Saccharofermentanales bacterium]
MDDNPYSYIKNNLIQVLGKVQDAALSCGRSPDDITIIGVSKLHPAEAAIAAIHAGLSNLGENRTEEMLPKIDRLRSEGLFPDWHMIGSLQRRKVRDIIGKVSLIHSADRGDLLQEISLRSAAAGIITPVLLEVNVSGEASKHGFTSDMSDKLYELSMQNTGIKVCGLMTMAPFTDDEKILNSVFFNMHELFDAIKRRGASPDFNILSMGMSNDYPIAIRHGATHIRVGTAIFGKNKK